MKYRFLRPFALVLAWGWLAPPQSILADAPALENHGPWDLNALKTTPKATWGKSKGLVREVYYEGAPYQGKPTRVFAYYARPKSGDGPFPAMVLVHGGGGTAFAEWASLWADRGYVALAMDLTGRGPGGERLPDGGPMQDHPHIFMDFSESTVDSVWPYQAVADVILGHSLLAAQPEVDRDRIGITGISWGGYLTCIVAGLDDRLKVAVPVYGCGFLGDNSAWLDNFRAMSPELRSRWLSFFDPSRYLPGVRCPILFVNGTNDFAYPLDSYQKSYRLIPRPVDLCVTVRMPHGHQEGWAPKEIGLYVDSVLLGKDPLARCGEVKIDGPKASTTVKSKAPLKEAKLNYTTDGGVWSSRKWQTADATLDGDRISAALPEGRPLVFFFTVKDQRDAIVSSPHAEVR